MATASRLMTVEEFSQLAEAGGEFYYELHHGELVQLTRPKGRHFKLQCRLRELLSVVARVHGAVETELPFRALPEHELRIADVAFVARDRWAAIDPDGYLGGAPELVIEVLSPSNTVVEMYDREALCLATGCLEFWVVDPLRKQVRITTADRITKTYGSADRIPLALFGNEMLSVSEIFES